MNNVPEDPRGYAILMEDNDDTRWYWIRLLDHKTENGFTTKQEAVDSALADAEEEPL